MKGAVGADGAAVDRRGEAAAADQRADGAGARTARGDKGPAAVEISAPAAFFLAVRRWPMTFLRLAVPDFTGAEKLLVIIADVAAGAALRPGRWRDLHCRRPYGNEQRLRHLPPLRRL